jgi:hypothetical protein
MSDQSHTFNYHGVELPLYYHMYNLTHLNERCVEIAIAHWWLDQPEIQAAVEKNMTRAWVEEGERTIYSGLEVGNVLGHYQRRTHTVIDWHEQPSWYQGLLGQEVLNYDLFTVGWGPYSPWVCSISTIEHMEDPLKAIEILRGFVAPGGKLLVTFPMGEREELDGLVLREEWREMFDRGCTIARTPEGGWKQTLAMLWQPYGPWANSVFVGEWEAPL